jgi:hypothetical protein
MKAQIAVHLIRLSIQIALLPLVVLILPLMFALAWLHEACADLAVRGNRDAAGLKAQAN